MTYDLVQLFVEIEELKKQKTVKTVLKIWQFVQANVEMENLTHEKHVIIDQIMVWIENVL
jgi:hypothetical protein